VDRIQGTRVFDRIVIFDVLEHFDLNSSVRILQKVHGILAKGGKILIRVPNVTSPWGLRMQFGSFDHVTLFSPGRLYELAKITGFEVTAIEGHTIGKRRKIFFERALHGILSRILTYHPEIWEAALICVFEESD
jgi:SAM-dependent methyltransferase